MLNHAMQPTHVYEVRPRKDKRGFDLISDVLPFVRSGTASQTQSATQSDTQSFSAGSRLAVIRVYDAAGI
jgi:hypothetical protein